MSKHLATQDCEFPDIGGGVAIISGSGILPRRIAEDCQKRNVNYRVVTFEGAVPEWVSAHPVICATFGNMGLLFREIEASGCTSVAFAGGMVRPQIDLAHAGDDGAERASDMQVALRQGDGATLRYFTELFEEQGLEVFATHAFLSDLVARPGVLTTLSPSAADRDDAARAAEIVRALGAVDVGQGAVVSQGICLAVESIQGTDRMLAFVREYSDAFRPDPDSAGGVLFKAAKPGQDRRIDLPAIGPGTMRAAAQTRLAGVAVEAGGALILERDETVAEANRLELFLWCREGSEG